MMNRHPDRLDLILDAAIRDYSNGEPRPGLELRILRHVQTRPRSRSGWRVAWALVVAAIALMVLIAPPSRRVSPPPLALLPPPVLQAAHPVIPAPPPGKRTSSHRSLPRSREAEPLPLTPDEQALLRLVRELPDQAVKVLSQPAELEALTIEPLKIEELQ